MNKPLSNCCHAPMKVEGDTTHYYVCTKCGKPCDICDDRKDLTKGKAMPKGTVKVFKQDKGFGFIKCEDDHPDVFFHISNIFPRGSDFLQVGERVEFNIVKTNKGFAADNVRLAM